MSPQILEVSIDFDYLTWLGRGLSQNRHVPIVISLLQSHSETWARGIIFDFALWMLNKLRYNFADLPWANGLQFLIYPVTKLILLHAYSVLSLDFQCDCLLSQTGQIVWGDQRGKWYLVVLVKINLGDIEQETHKRFLKAAILVVKWNRWAISNWASVLWQIQSFLLSGQVSRLYLWAITQVLGCPLTE